MRSALLTRLGGLPSDELFAIPATRTASVFVEGFNARNKLGRCLRARGLNHDANPTQRRPRDPATTRSVLSEDSARSRNEKGVANGKAARDEHPTVHGVYQDRRLFVSK